MLIQPLITQDPRNWGGMLIQNDDCSFNGCTLYCIFGSPRHPTPMQQMFAIFPFLTYPVSTMVLKCTVKYTTNLASNSNKTF